MLISENRLYAIARYLHGELNTNGGGTSSLRETPKPLYGYYVGGFLGKSHTVKTCTIETIARFIRENNNSPHDAYVGVWQHENGVDLDFVYHAATRRLAIALGKDWNQRTVWDIKNGVSIDVAEANASLWSR